MKNVSMILYEKLKSSVYVQARYIGGGPSAFKLSHTAPPIYLNSDLKGPLTAGVREAIHYSISIPSQKPLSYSVTITVRYLSLINFLIKEKFQNSLKLGAYVSCVYKTAYKTSYFRQVVKHKCYFYKISKCYSSLVKSLFLEDNLKSEI